MESALQVSRECQETFRKAVLTYYKRQGRDLPWRRTRDPYAVLVSEIMLQQTQVDRVVPKFLAFMERFPTPAALARAPVPDVLSAWQGLGYNRRALYLRDAAAFLSAHPLPTFQQLVSLKGIGPYTAAAVCAFAYNEDVAAVDVNVERVFSRFFGAADYAFIADAVPSGASRDWHNALMDFGSAVCTKRSPSCDACPLSGRCHALANDAFSTEASSSQPRFLGSVRWHRGQALKLLLVSRRTEEDLWGALDAKHRDRERLRAALSQLEDEGFIRADGSSLSIVV